MSNGAETLRASTTASPISCIAPRLGMVGGSLAELNYKRSERRSWPRWSSHARFTVPPSRSWRGGIQEAASFALELHVFVRRGEREARDESQPGLLHPRADAGQPGDLIDRRDDHLVVDQLLDA